MELARQYGRYGYRRIGGRLWLNDGSCIRLRAERADHVWSYDFLHHRTHDGRAFRMLNVLDEFTRESLAIRVGRKLSSSDVIDVLTDLFILRGIPAWIRSDNGRSSSPRPCDTGSLQSGPGPPSSSRGRPGRTAISRASMRTCATSS